MATSTQLTAPSGTATTTPLTLWHLLSLDAPTVAALWTWFLARANHIRLPLASPAAMGIAVWMLYAADRLLDARVLDTTSAKSTEAYQLEARHRFHHRHRPVFLVGIGIAACALAALLPRLDTVSIRLYLTEGALLFAWFLVLHATRSAHRLPKEIAVGLFFGAATFVPTIAREPNLRPVLVPAALLFAALCSLNCLFIYAWEHEYSVAPGAQKAHLTTRIALRYLQTLALAEALAGTALAALYPASPRPIAMACMLSAVLLLSLDRYHRRLPAVPLRAAADLVLLTPFAVLPFIR